MKVVIFVCSFAAAAFVVAGAPLLSDANDEQVVFYPRPQFRARRSQYAPSYASPCGAQLPALAPAPAYLSPVHSGYGYGGLGGLSGGGLSGGGISGGHSYGYAPLQPHYRADEMETDIMNFSDMDQGMSEHVPMARYGTYGGGHAGAVPALSAYGGQLGPAVASGPAFGVFPNANTGGCNVPLLLSCSPSIVPGRLVKGQSYGGGYGAGVVAGVGNAYRGVDEQQHLEQEEHVETPAHENLEPAEDKTHSGGAGAHQ